MIKEGINKQKMTFREGSNSSGGVIVTDYILFFAFSDIFCIILDFLGNKSYRTPKMKGGRTYGNTR